MIQGSLERRRTPVVESSNSSSSSIDSGEVSDSLWVNRDHEKGKQKVTSGTASGLFGSALSLFNTSPSATTHNGHNSSPVNYLVNHKESLSRRLQELLDRQWDGLSEKKGRWIVTARQGIDKTMSELLETETALAELYQAEMSGRRAWLERTKVIQDKIAELQGHIAQIETDSDLASRIRDLEKEQTGINDEIAELQFKLKQLYSKKQKNESEIHELKSTMMSRSSSYRHEVAELEPAVPTGEEVERYSREAEAFSEEQDVANKEITALKDGIVVWRDVCMLIGDLEKSLEGSLSASMSSLGSRPGVIDSKHVYELLSSAVEKLRKHLRIAEKNRWSLLTVAITHELEALEEGIQLVVSSAPGVIERDSDKNSGHEGDDDDEDDGANDGSSETITKNWAGP
ncbi:hypothetical protein TRVA0_028S01354 [Trichomonascus vanleenenianus]|uniref:uncharacterized protein n=1 Tax=Trichomonascus vanleenenianus TaxID=2268995 RepID=UPI003EC9C70C